MRSWIFVLACVSQKPAFCFLQGFQHKAVSLHDNISPVGEADRDDLANLADLARELDVNKRILYTAADTKTVDSELVVNTLLRAEKLVKNINKVTTSPRPIDELKSNLVGDWRLIFTTGTLKQQKKTGVKVNYFPLKAVQSFTSEMSISNAIYVFDYPVLKFEGLYDLVEVGDSTLRLEFDFDILTLAGLKLNLGGKGAVEIGEKTGLGSGTGIIDNKTKKKRAFFNWR